MSDYDGDEEEDYDDDEDSQISGCSGGYWRWASLFHTADTLRDLCLKNLARDHVLEIYADRIKEIPKDIFEDLLQKISVYGLHLLEQHKALSKEDAEPFWKKHFSHFSSNPIGIQEMKNKPDNDDKKSFKSKLFEGLFLRMIGFMAQELVCESTLSADVLDSFLDMFRPESELRCFDLKGQIDWSDANCKNIIAMFESNLDCVTIYPSFLPCLSEILELDFMNSITTNTRHVEFHDFFRFKDHHMLIMDSFLHPGNFPNLSCLSFICCKCDKDSLEYFETLIKDFVEESLPSDQTNHIAAISESKLKRIEENYLVIKPIEKENIHEGYLSDNSEQIPIKKQRKSFDTDVVSFDEAFCPDEIEYEQEEQCLDIYNFDSIVCSKNSTQDKKEELKCQLNQLEFVNCYISENAINKFCEIIVMIPLRKFTFQPEHFMLTSLYKIFAAAFGNIPTVSSLKTKECKPSLESLNIHDSSLDYYCKKLILWHKPGECKQQHGVFVPSLKHLEIVDCDLGSYQYDCNCMSHPEIVSNRIVRPKIALNLPEPLHNTQCIEAFNWHFDIDQLCTCNWSRLETVDLTNNPLKCKGAKAIAEALKTALRLKSLTLSGCQIDTEGCASIFTMARDHPSLKNLNVSNNTFETTKHESLASLVEHGTLLKLYINNLIAKGHLSARLMEAFSKNSKITHLAMSVNRLGNEGMNEISQVLAEKTALSSLQYLDLSGNLIESSAMEQFLFALQTSERTLDELLLHANKINTQELRYMKIDHLIAESVRKPVYYDSMQWRFASADHKNTDEISRHSTVEKFTIDGTIEGKLAPYKATTYVENSTYAIARKLEYRRQWLHTIVSGIGAAAANYG